MDSSFVTFETQTRADTCLTDSFLVCGSQGRAACVDSVWVFLGKIFFFFHFRVQILILFDSARLIDPTVNKLLNLVPQFHMRPTSSSCRFLSLLLQLLFRDESYKFSPVGLHCFFFLFRDIQCDRSQSFIRFFEYFSVKLFLSRKISPSCEFPRSSGDDFLWIGMPKSARVNLWLAWTADWVRLAREKKRRKVERIACFRLSFNMRRSSATRSHQEKAWEWEWESRIFTIGLGGWFCGFSFGFGSNRSIRLFVKNIYLTSISVYF